MANGGEVGDPDDEFIQAVNTKLGRTPDGRPKEQGLKPVIDLEDAVNVTPIGDVLSAKDAYNAARNNDWLGVGLATATMIPCYKYGGIHIKKKNRGKFNALKKRTGKSTEELTHSKNPLTRKRAIFAQNAKKWNKGKKKK
jgi:hypothetical protein